MRFPWQLFQLIFLQSFINITLFFKPRFSSLKPQNTPYHRETLLTQHYLTSIPIDLLSHSTLIAHTASQLVKCKPNSHSPLRSAPHRSNLLIRSLSLTIFLSPTHSHTLFARLSIRSSTAAVIYLTSLINIDGGCRLEACKAYYVCIGLRCYAFFLGGFDLRMISFSSRSGLPLVYHTTFVWSPTESCGSRHVFCVYDLFKPSVKLWTPQRTRARGVWFCAAIQFFRDRLTISSLVRYRCTVLRCTGGSWDKDYVSWGFWKLRKKLSGVRYKSEFYRRRRNSGAISGKS